MLHLTRAPVVPQSYCPKHSKNEKLSGESDSDGEPRRADPDSEAQRRTRKQKYVRDDPPVPAEIAPGTAAWGDGAWGVRMRY